MLVINCFGDMPISATDRFWEMSVLEAITFSMIALAVVGVFMLKKRNARRTI